MQNTCASGKPLAPLPEGTRIGPWRVVRWHAQGAHGAVYQASRAKPSWSSPVALKLALFPEDPRFAREAALLSRVRHPCIPQLLGHGDWKHPACTVHPFLALQWIDGMPLYEWASARNPSSRQVLQLLAQLARALQAIHGAHAVHRDVKGGNILVRPSDAQPFLTDFGSGDHQGSERLTWQAMFPTTLPYRSPEASRFAFRFIHEPESHYVAQPFDDLFSLGVTAYRLLTGLYPPTQLPSAAAAAWSPEDTGPWSLRERNPRVAPPLGASVLRMLSVQPEARGTAQELAEALEFAAVHAGDAADMPLFAPLPTPSAGARPSQQIPPHVHTPRHLARFALLATGMLLLVWLGQTVLYRAGLPMHALLNTGRPGTDIVAVGDALTAPSAAHLPPSTSEGIALELPTKPLPGQYRPNASNQCPRRGQIALHGGCWIEQFTLDAEACKENADTTYVYKGRCYAPAFPPQRPSTSTQDPNALPWRGP
jgi:eukaryotic-like serine/threonine-protein kinase